VYTGITTPIISVVLARRFHRLGDRNATDIGKPNANKRPPTWSKLPINA